MGIKTRGQILQVHLAPKKSGKKGSIAGHYPKHLNLMSIVFARQNSGKDHMRRPCIKKDALVEWHGIWRKYYKLKNADKTTVYSPIEARVMPSPTSKSPEEREFVVHSGASMHVMSTMSKRPQEKENRRGNCGSETATSMFGVKKPIERKASLFFGFEYFIRPVCR